MRFAFLFVFVVLGILVIIAILLRVTIFNPDMGGIPLTQGQSPTQSVDAQVESPYPSGVFELLYHEEVVRSGNALNIRWYRNKITRDCFYLADYAYGSNELTSLQSPCPPDSK
jgi:hypothetical protein